MQHYPAQVRAGVGLLSTAQKDPLQIGDNMAIVQLSKDQAGLLLCSTGDTPPLLLPPEGVQGRFSYVLSNYCMKIVVHGLLEGGS